MSHERKIWKRWAINPNHNILDQFYEITQDIGLYSYRDNPDFELLCNITVWRKMYLECGGRQKMAYNLNIPAGGIQKLTFMGFSLNFDGNVKEEEIVVTWTLPNGLNRIIDYFLRAGRPV